MNLADGIRKHGFRKWYERELIQSHLHLVLTVLSAFGLLAAFEALGGSSGLTRLANLAGIGACGVIGVWAIRRYLYLLMHAESLANQANCPSCRTYARFDLAADAPPPSRQPDEGAPLRVRCRQCGQHWMING